MDKLQQQENVDRPEASIIGAGITVTGNIEAVVDLQVQGKVIGDVRCATLILGEKSIIKGSVYADRVRVAGTIEGSIETKDLAIESMAVVTGDVSYSRVRIANGGIVAGHMKHVPSSEEGSDGSKLRLVEAEPLMAKPVYIE